jgi:hypothetical protein
MNFQPVQGRSIEGEGNGLMQILRGGKLITFTNGEKSEAPLAAGTQVTGVYGGSTPNKFDEAKVDYNLRADDGTLIILAQTASLAQQFAKVSEGELVQVTYNGKRQITRKNGQKTEMHDFVVARAVEAE